MSILCVCVCYTEIQALDLMEASLHQGRKVCCWIHSDVRQPCHATARRELLLFHQPKKCLPDFEERCLASCRIPFKALVGFRLWGLGFRLGLQARESPNYIRMTISEDRSELAATYRHANKELCRHLPESTGLWVQLCRDRRFGLAPAWLQHRGPNN